MKKLKEFLSELINFCVEHMWTVFFIIWTLNAMIDLTGMVTHDPKEDSAKVVNEKPVEKEESSTPKSSW